MANVSIFPGDLTDSSKCLRLPERPVQHFIINTFWPLSKSSTTEHVSYFRYFRWAISMLAWPEGTVDKSQYAIQTYGDLAKVVQSLRTHSDQGRVELARILEAEFPRSTRAQIHRSIDLTARLWLMVHVKSEDFYLGPALSDVTGIHWSENTSLRQLITDYFPVTSSNAAKDGASIDITFTAKNLHKLCRIKIQWTANLVDHLVYDHVTSTLKIYPHKVCLIGHLNCRDIFPRALVLETIRTLDVLFPFGEESTQKFLEERGQIFYRTPSIDLSRPQHFGEFHYWQKRLLELHDVFNQAPRSLLQMWHDRRNPMQWWTFWLAAFIAVLTIVFGIIASYTGFQQVAIAEKAYQLSILQACAQGNVPDSLC